METSSSPPKDRNATSRRFSFIKIALITIALLSPLILAEIAARIDMAWRGQPFRESQVHYTYTPYVSYVYQPFSVARKNLTTDRHGFIHNGHDQERDLRDKAADQFRVFILGGSSTAGTYVNGPEDTIASRLERRLTQEFKDRDITLRPQVINGGVSSYFSAQEVMLLNFVVNGLHPDYVIFFDGTNDCHYQYDPKSYASDATIIGLMRGNYNPYTHRFMSSYNNMFSFAGLLRQSALLLSQHSALFRWFSEEHYTRFINKYDKEVARIKQFLAGGSLAAPKIDYRRDYTINAINFRNNVRTAVSLTTGYPIRISYTVQPSLFSGLPISPSPAERDLLEPIQSAIPDSTVCYQKLADELEKLRLEFNDNTRVRFTDLRDIFKSKTPEETVFGDPVHYTNLGREIIVNSMMQTFGDHILDAAEDSRRRLK